MSKLLSEKNSGLMRFRCISISIIAVLLLLLLGSNLLMLGHFRNQSDREYRVDITRASSELAVHFQDCGDFRFVFERDGDGSFTTNIFPDWDFDFKKYPSLLRVSTFQPEEVINHDYEVREVCGKMVCFEYEIKPDLRPLIYMNIGMGLAIVVTAVVLFYIGNRVLRPFNKMSRYSEELARGNLSTPMKAEKNKFFGKFLWGINMLRDNLESNKERELEMQKDKKTLILSLSHDIKTPLSAIKLYTRALDEDLYDTEEKKKEAISGIAHNASEIEKYVSEIVTASKEDFLDLQVQMQDVYLNGILDRIEVLYKEKFSQLHTDFSISGHTDVLVSADPERLEEVMQNVLENAIKYGDGKKVSISFSDEEDCRLITISNSGCSLKEEEIPHLFESFYRGSNASNVKGSGLGLYIARTLMRMMDGDIFVRILPSVKENHTGDFAVTLVVRKA